MIKRAKFDAIWVELGGVKREILGLPCRKRRRFIALQAVAAEIVGELPDCGIGFIYDHYPDFRDAIDESLELYGLSPEWVSARELNYLFFSWESGAGLLWQLEFPDEPAIEGRLLNPEVDPYHAQIAAIWSYSPDKTLAEVMAAIEDIPCRDLEGILDQRNQLAEEADPEYAKKQEKKRQDQQLMDALKDFSWDDFAEETGGVSG